MKTLALFLIIGGSYWAGVGLGFWSNPTKPVGHGQDANGDSYAVVEIHAFGHASTAGVMATDTAAAINKRLDELGVVITVRPV